MNEVCCRFGPENRLAGIITEPGGRAPRLGLVLVSAGLLPKAGPFRLYAELARSLANAGVVTLRFDLGGLGDSAQEQGDRQLEARTESEIGAALDCLSERFALSGIVLGGLCSGAEDSFRVAASEKRVTGLVMIDPFAYRTTGWAWRHLRHRLWRRALRALGLYLPVAHERAKIVSYQYLERVEAASMLRALLARNTRMHFIYTSGVRERLNHERQFRALFRGLDLKDLVTVDYLPQLDHTPLLQADRDTLIKVIARHLATAT